MSRRFKVVMFGPKGELARIYSEPRTDADSVEAFVKGFLLKVDSEAESEEWIRIKCYRNQADPEERSGWVPIWVAGEPIPDLPETVSAYALTWAAAGLELELSVGTDPAISTEYLIALFLIENDLDAVAPDLKDDTAFTVKQDRPNRDAVGGFAVTSDEWNGFLTGTGVAPGSKNPSIRYFTMPQMRCAAYLTQRDWQAFARLSGGTPTNPLIPRNLDLFLSRLVGAEAAAEVARRERSKTGLGDPIVEVVRAANDWNVGSLKEKALLAHRARFLVDAAGASVSVDTVLGRCRDALDPALRTADKAVKLYIPGFTVSSSPSGQIWFDLAKAEYIKWEAGKWTEHSPPGQGYALDFFKATDHGPGKITDPATGEITDWCGAFVAHFVKKAGAVPPSGAAAAASWRTWGDVAFPKRPPADIPHGAVVTLAGSESDPESVSHVCFFAGWDGDSHFIGLGGNQSDSVTMARMAVERIVAIRSLADTAVSSDNDLEILAKTLYGEIRGAEKDEQIRNVADVVLNRFLTGYRSQGSIAGTCMAPAQFSCWDPGMPPRRILDRLSPDDPKLTELREIAANVIEQRLSKGATFQPLEGARHYHAHGSHPKWKDPSRFVHDDGKHIFYAGIP